MRRAVVVGLFLVLTGSPAAAKSAPKADESAQDACMTVRHMDVDAEFGAPRSQTMVAALLESLRTTRSKGGKALGKDLFAAPTSAAQTVVINEARDWCTVKLTLRCSALACEGGRRVTTIPA